MTCDDCGAAPAARPECPDELASDPFLALRVAYGMLLGEDDFRVLGGNPRGKQMLHSAWLHGTGVVWGFDVRSRGDYDLVVDPGMAIDGLGRELLLPECGCLNVWGWVGEHRNLLVGDGPERTIAAHVEVAFDARCTDPVPTPADPCDVNRGHDDFSRIVESCRVRLVPGPPPPACAAYHRLRVLFGLEKPADGDEAGAAAYAARRAIARTAPENRSRALLAAFRELALLDSLDLGPAVTEAGPTRYPVPPERATVTIAGVVIGVLSRDGGDEVTGVVVDRDCRTVLLPTGVLQELTCRSPGASRPRGPRDAGGPRVTDGSWSPDGKVCRVRVDKPLRPESVGVDAVRVTSLSEHGWIDEDVASVTYADEVVSVLLKQAPKLRPVRVLIAGSGPTPILGRVPLVPLAGLVGGPPGTATEGRDAVLMFETLGEEES